MATKKKRNRLVSHDAGTVGAPYNFENRGILIDDWLKEQLAKQQNNTLIFLLRLFAFVVAATFSLIFLKGFGLVALTDELMTYLVGAGIAEVAGLLLMIIPKIFIKR